MSLTTRPRSSPKKMFKMFIKQLRSHRQYTCTIINIYWFQEILFSDVHLNKFYFSDVHLSMNTMGLVQSKWCPKGVKLTLHGIHCIHTSMKVRKIHLIFTLCFYIGFIYYLFWWKRIQISGKEKLQLMCLVIVFNGHLHGMTTIERYIGQSTISFICDITCA